MTKAKTLGTIGIMMGLMLIVMGIAIMPMAYAADLTKTKFVFSSVGAAAGWEPIENPDGTVTRININIIVPKEEKNAIVELWIDTRDPDNPEVPPQVKVGNALVPKKSIEIANDLSTIVIPPLAIKTCILDDNQEQCVSPPDETHTIQAKWTAIGEPQTTFNAESKSKTIYQDQKVTIKASSDYTTIDAKATASLDSLELGDSSGATIATSDILYIEKVHQS